MSRLRWSQHTGVHVPKMPAKPPRPLAGGLTELDSGSMSAQALDVALVLETGLDFAEQRTAPTLLYSYSVKCTQCTVTVA